jgi:hypothetical protein
MSNQDEMEAYLALKHMLRDKVQQIWENDPARETMLDSAWALMMEHGIAVRPTLTGGFAAAKWKAVGGRNHTVVWNITHIEAATPQEAIVRCVYMLRLPEVQLQIESDDNIGW